MRSFTIGGIESVTIEELKREHDGLYWKFKALERKVSNLESELRRLRK